MANREPDPLEGLPPDLARILRDPSILVPQDAAVFELIVKAVEDLRCPFVSAANVRCYLDRGHKGGHRPYPPEWDAAAPTREEEPFGGVTLTEEQSREVADAFELASREAHLAVGHPGTFEQCGKLDCSRDRAALALLRGEQT